MSDERRVASSSGTGHDAHDPLCAIHGFTGQCSCGASPDSFFHRPADLPVAAPDPAKTLRRALNTAANRWGPIPGRPGDFEDGNLETREEAFAALAALLAERQQDKERIERLTEVGKAAQIVAELNGESRATYGRVVTHIEWVNAMFRLETAVVAARAALAVEEDAENG